MRDAIETPPDVLGMVENRNVDMANGRMASARNAATAHFNHAASRHPAGMMMSIPH